MFFFLLLSCSVRGFCPLQRSSAILATTRSSFHANKKEDSCCLILGVFLIVTCVYTSVRSSPPWMDKSADSDPRSDFPTVVEKKSTVWKQNVRFFSRDRGKKVVGFLGRGCSGWETCFEAHMLEEGKKWNKKIGALSGRRRAAVAPHERSPERELQVQPVGPWASGGDERGERLLSLCLFPPSFSQILTLARSKKTGGFHHLLIKSSSGYRDSFVLLRHVSLCGWNPSALSSVPSTLSPLFTSLCLGFLVLVFF